MGSQRPIVSIGSSSSVSMLNAIIRMLLHFTVDDFDLNCSQSCSSENDTHHHSQIGFSRAMV